MPSNVERCPRCGRFMRYEDSAEWGEIWVCARQSAHILADPEGWTVDTIALPENAVDIDGDPVSGMIRAELLTTEQLRIALGVDEPVHWVSDAPTSLHGNGAASFERTTRDRAEVTCRLCRFILRRDEEDHEPTGRESQ